MSKIHNTLISNNISKNNRFSLVYNLLVNRYVVKNYETQKQDSFVHLKDAVEFVDNQ